MANQQYKHNSQSYVRYYRSNNILRRPPKLKAYMAGLYDSRFCVTCARAHGVCNWRIRYSNKDRGLIDNINEICGLGKNLYTKFSMGIIDAKTFVEAISPYCMIKHRHNRMILKYCDLSIRGKISDHGYFIENIQGLNQIPEGRYLEFPTSDEYIGYINGVFTGTGKIGKNNLSIELPVIEPIKSIQKAMAGGEIQERKRKFRITWSKIEHLILFNEMLFIQSNKTRQFSEMFNL